MIITVTLNAAIDKSLPVPNFRLGRRHRTVEQTTLPGGKGVNVARTLKTLGQPVIATGFAGGATGTRIVEALTDEANPNDFVRVLEAEELVGHEFNDDEDRVIAVREMVALGAVEAIMTVPDGCFASVVTEGEAVLYRVRIEPREAVATVGAGDAFLAGYVAARYGDKPAAEGLR